MLTMTFVACYKCTRNRQVDLAVAMPDVVKAMREHYDQLGANACTPDVGSCLDYVGVADQAAWVAQTLATMRVGPLPAAGGPLQPEPSPPPPPPGPPPPPLPPPGPPLAPSLLAGTWSVKTGGGGGGGGADKPEVTVTLVNRTETDEILIHAVAQCHECCWTTASGTVTADGRGLMLNATGPACVRYGVGRVEGDAPHALTVVWQCYKDHPPSDPNTQRCSWPDWEQQGGL
jgi:hypothetical protein